MPKVSNNNDPLYERLIFGYDGAVYRVVKIDADGNIVSAIKTGQTIAVTQAIASNLKALVDVNAGQTISVTQATASNLKALIDVNTGQNIKAYTYGWYNSSQYKNPLALGYSDRIYENVVNSDLPAGVVTINGSATPANTVYILTNVAAMYYGTVPTVMRVQANLGGTGITIFDLQSPVSSVFQSRQGKWVLKAGDYVNMYISSATLHDSAYLNVMGYKMDLVT